MPESGRAAGAKSRASLRRVSCSDRRNCRAEQATGRGKSFALDLSCAGNFESKVYFLTRCVFAIFSAYAQNWPIVISKNALTAAITSQLTFALPRSIWPK